MLTWLLSRSHYRLLQSLEDEVSSLHATIQSKDLQLSQLQLQNETLLRRALEAEARRDSEGNRYLSHLDDMRKQMDWMARLVGKGPIYERQLSDGRVDAPSTMDEITEFSDPDAQAAYAEFVNKGMEFLKELEDEG